MSTTQDLAADTSSWVRRVPEAETGDGPLADASAVWIAWEVQRRTTELAARLGVPLARYLYRGPGPLRYLALAGRTWSYLRSHRPRILIVQNPSLILAALACLARRFFGFRLVVDRHTNFMLNRPSSLRKTVFGLISRFTLRNADLTIVTNAALAEIVDAAGGRGFVLPDRIPALPAGEDFEAGSGKVVVFICTYAGDEPWAEVLEAAPGLGPDTRVFITGNEARIAWTPRTRALREAAANVTLTGYLEEADYAALLRRADVVMDLTTFDHCLVCGAYEGLAAGKAMVLSDKAANRELFEDVPVYVAPDAASIRDGLRRALAESDVRARRAVEFRDAYAERWEAWLADLVSRVREA